MALRAFAPRCLGRLALPLEFRPVRTAFVPLAVALAAATPAVAQRASDDDIKRQMIAESIAGYRGACPCPDNRMKNGARCGGRSAYSRPGGASVLCYPADITPTMLEDYKRRRGVR